MCITVLSNCIISSLAARGDAADKIALSFKESVMRKVPDGWLNGLIGVVIFSGSMPATRVAVMDLDPVFVTVARAAVAGILAFGMLAWFRAKRPSRADLMSLTIVAGGVVLGFPLLSALALRHV